MHLRSSVSGAGSFEQRCLIRYWIKAFAGVLVTVLVLSCAGYLSRPLLKAAWQSDINGWPSLAAFKHSRMALQGVLIGMMGGMRALTANLLWIQSFEQWSRKDIAANAVSMQLALAVDSRNIALWQNAADIMAYDWPKWRIEQYERQHGQLAPAWFVREVRHEYANAALKLINQAYEHHTGDYRLIVDAAMIHRNCLGDTERAAELFRYGSRLPNAPYFLARTYGELLREQGKKGEALEWYKRIYKRLPNHPHAQKSVVLDRIRDLEKELDIPPWQCFQSE